MEDPALGFLLEILKLLIVGIIGGWFGSRLNWGSFRRRAKHEYERERLNVLVDLLGTTVPEIAQGLQSSWAAPNMMREEKISALNDLKQAVDLAIPWFEGDKQITMKLHVLQSLIGLTQKTSDKAGLRMWEDFFEIKNALREAVATTQQALYGKPDAKVPWYRRLFASPPK